VLGQFGTNPFEGLSADQVARARAQYGTNELPTEPPPSIFKLILEQFDDLLVKILLAAALIDLGLAIVNGDTGFTAFIDPFVIGLILAANAAVGVATESNAAAAIAALREMGAESARCLRGGTLQNLPVRELVPGDVVEVRVGDKAPADCYVMEIHGATLRVDQSIVTGESGSVDKVAGPINAPPGAVAQDKLNIVFSGSMITSGRYAQYLRRNAAVLHLQCVCLSAASSGSEMFWQA
jgi:P-type Ca2+ transporter type 2A